MCGTLGICCLTTKGMCGTLGTCRISTKRNVWDTRYMLLNPLKAELNRICHLLALLGAHHILHFSRIRVNYQNECVGHSVYVA
jgi:hypothetical protein